MRRRGVELAETNDSAQSSGRSRSVLPLKRTQAYINARAMRSDLEKLPTSRAAKPKRSQADDESSNIAKGSLSETSSKTRAKIKPSLPGKNSNKTHTASQRKVSLTKNARVRDSVTAHATVSASASASASDGSSDESKPTVKAPPRLSRQQEYQQFKQFLAKKREEEQAAAKLKAATKTQPKASKGGDAVPPTKKRKDESDDESKPTPNAKKRSPAAIAATTTTVKQHTKQQQHHNEDETQKDVSFKSEDSSSDNASTNANASVSADDVSSASAKSGAIISEEASDESTSTREQEQQSVTKIPKAVARAQTIQAQERTNLQQQQARQGAHHSLQKASKGSHQKPLIENGSSDEDSDSEHTVSVSESALKIVVPASNRSAKPYNGNHDANGTGKHKASNDKRHKKSKSIKAKDHVGRHDKSHSVSVSVSSHRTQPLDSMSQGGRRGNKADQVQAESISSSFSTSSSSSSQSKQTSSTSAGNSSADDDTTHATPDESTKHYAKTQMQRHQNRNHDSAPRAKQSSETRQTRPFVTTVNACTPGSNVAAQSNQRFVTGYAAPPRAQAPQANCGPQAMGGGLVKACINCGLHHF